MSKTQAVSTPAAMNVEQRLVRALALAALMENVVEVLPPTASVHDFTCDPVFFEGLAAVAGIIRADMAAAREALDFPASQRVAPDVS